MWNQERGSPMTPLQHEILKEAIELLKKFPKDKTVHKEQSEIIHRVLREIKP
jgi:hypothetical protein